MSAEDERVAVGDERAPLDGSRPRIVPSAFTVVGALALALVVSPVSAAAAPNADLLAFLGPQGCAIGPSTRKAAADSGFEAAAIDGLLDAARADPASVETGGWIVLGPELCTIEPPEVTSEIRPGAPEVKASTSAIDEFAEFGDLGCFIDAFALVESVRKTRGWDEEKANREYLRFLSEGLRSGELAFFSDTPLKTPSGFQLTTGDCAGIPRIEDIRRSRDLRGRHFDALVRTDAANVRCESRAGPSFTFREIETELIGQENPNAWSFFEVQMMAIGGGWYEGTGATTMGTPRPPLCRYG